MASSVYASGANPISYTADGKQVFIPLNVVTIVNDKADVKTADLNAAGITGIDETELKEWINKLIASGEPKKIETPYPKPAFRLIANKITGCAGNKITAEVKRNPAVGGAPETFDITICLEEEFADLVVDNSNPNFLEKKLDASALITVKPPDGGNYALPKSYDTLPLVGGNGTSSATAMQDDNATEAFVVEAKEEGEQGNNISVKITKDQNAFSMEVTMTETYAAAEVNEKKGNAKNPNYIGTLLKDSYLVKFEKVGDAVPSDGKYNLSGGQDPQDSVPASTSVLGYV